MSVEILKQIEQAEHKAADRYAQAQREARDIIKAVEEACLADERNAQLEHRALSQRVQEDARATAKKQIVELEKAEVLEAEKVTKAAQQRLPEAARLIFERVVTDGSR